MRLNKNLVQNSLVLLLLTLGIEQASATLYCNRTYTELTQNPGRPYNAVGYLNNGCTAFLTDPDHIIASAHCFVNPVTGEWQTGLRFYPNFHPGRVTNDANHVPRGNVTDVVVGSRAGESKLGEGMSWGIARIENWRDTAGLDMTPIVFGLIPPVGTTLENPAYTRHHFPFDDADADVWDNMKWDDTLCDWVNESSLGAQDGGMWAIVDQPAPTHGGLQETVGCNQRWAAGMHHGSCALKKVVNDVLFHNCDTIGGSSGSPIMYRASNGRWRVIGVGHGGGTPLTKSSNKDFEQKSPGPTCSLDIPANHDNVGASMERFRNAPRFAANSAIHRRPDNASATAVFVVDSDLNRIVYRARSGTPKYNGKFSFWQSLGTPRPGAQLSRIAACSADMTGTPELFVVSDNSRIYSRRAQPNGNWSSWDNIGIPAQAGGVVDIDTTHDNNGRCQLFMVSGNGNVYTRAKTTDKNWQSWKRVALGHTGNASGSFAKISALNYTKTVWVTLVDKIGQLWRSKDTVQGWTDPVKLNMASGVGAWHDIDMTWDEAGRGFILAIQQGGGNKLWFLPMYGDKAWFGWRYFDTHLWAPTPGVAPQDAPNLLSVTASRWMEDPAGTTSPVIFATGDKGNLYFIEYTRVGTPRWILDWKSFYHESIVY